MRRTHSRSAGCGGRSRNRDSDRWRACAGSARAACCAAVHLTAAGVTIAPWAVPWRSINRGPVHVERLGETVALPTALRLLVRVHANQTIDLHLGELPAAGVQRFEAQRGTYRVSGGRIEIHPQMGGEPVNFILDHLVDQKPGTTVSPPTVRSRSWCEMRAPYQPYFAPQR